MPILPGIALGRWHGLEALPARATQFSEPKAVLWAGLEVPLWGVGDGDGLRTTDY